MEATLCLFLISFTHHSFPLVFPSFFASLFLSFLTVFLSEYFLSSILSLFCSLVLSFSSCFLLSYSLFLLFLFPSLFPSLNLILSIHLFPFLCAFIIYLFCSPCFIISLFPYFFPVTIFCLNPAILYKLMSDIWQVEVWEHNRSHWALILDQSFLFPVVSISKTFL